MHRSTRGAAAAAACLLAVMTAGCSHNDLLAKATPAQTAEKLVLDQADGTSHEGQEAAAVIMYVHALDRAIVATGARRGEAYRIAYQQNACMGQVADRKFASRMQKQVIPILTTDAARHRGWVDYVRATSSMAALSPNIDACNALRPI